MLNLYRRKPNTSQVAELLALRMKLFATQDLEILVKSMNKQEQGSPPGLFIVAAAYELMQGNQTEAIAELQQATQPGYSAWWRLAAWHQLRQLGVQIPEAQDKIVRALVLEYPVKDRRVILAAYADHSARYLDGSGRLFSWDQPDSNAAQLIDEFMTSGQAILQHAPLWNKPEPGPPAGSNTRLSILTDAGLHFSQGPAKILSKDPLSGKIVQCANTLIAKINSDLNYVPKRLI